MTGEVICTELYSCYAQLIYKKVQKNAFMNEVHDQKWQNDKCNIVKEPFSTVHKKPLENIKTA